MENTTGIYENLQGIVLWFESLKIEKTQTFDSCHHTHLQQCYNKVHLVRNFCYKNSRFGIGFWCDLERAFICCWNENFFLYKNF